MGTIWPSPPCHGHRVHPAPLPEWLYGFLTPRQAKRAPNPAVAASSRASRCAAAALTGESAAVANAPDDGDAGLCVHDDERGMLLLYGNERVRGI